MLQRAGRVRQMRARVLIRHQKSCSETCKRYQPCRVAEAEMRRTCPNRFLITGEILDQSQPQFILGSGFGLLDARRISLDCWAVGAQMFSLLALLRGLLVL